SIIGCGIGHRLPRLALRSRSEIVARSSRAISTCAMSASRARARWGKPAKRPCSVGNSSTLVRDRRGVGRVLLDAADEIERGVERLVILRVRRDVGLRAGLLVAFGLEVAAQRSLAARVGARFE